MLATRFSTAICQSLNDVTDGDKNPALAADTWKFQTKIDFISAIERPNCKIY